MPCLVARYVWENRFRRRRVISFIDNDGARDVLIKGYAPGEHSANLAWHFWLRESALEAVTWFSRVPSDSNLADGPSRGGFGCTNELGATKVDVRLSGKELLSFAQPVS